MKRKIVCEGHALRMVLGITMLALLLAIGVEAATITVDDNGGADYKRIQDAIDNASYGDTIIVYSGTYDEKMNVNKTLNLRGVNSGEGKPVVNGSNEGNRINFTAENIIFDGFNITRGYLNEPTIYLNSNNSIITNNTLCSSINDFCYYGIYIFSSSNNILRNNTINPAFLPVYFVSSNNNTFINNEVNSNDFPWSNRYSVTLISSFNNTIQDNVVNRGIGLYSSINNTIERNNAYSSPNEGIYLENSNNNSLIKNFVSDTIYGVFLRFSHNNTIEENNASLNWCGIYLVNSNNNIIINNIAQSVVNAYQVAGIYLLSSGNNKIYHNNIMATHTRIAYDNFNNNSWDNGYPSGGNYWSDYTGSDVMSGPNQDQSGGDGIGDVPHGIYGGAGARDRYPFMMENGWKTSSIVVTSPNVGETWARGSTQMISWTYSGTPGSNVRIELLKGGVINHTINSSFSIGVSGSGSYNWPISSIQTADSDYKVKITSTTNATYYDTSDNNFTILAIPNGYSYIYGKVINNSIGIAGALITTNASFSATTDTSGFYSLLVPVGEYNLTAAKEPAYYKNSSVFVTAISGNSVLKNIMLVQKLTGTISGTILRS